MTPMQRATRTTTLIAIVALAAATVVGCSRDDDAGSTSSAAVTSAPGVTAEPSSAASEAPVTSIVDDTALPVGTLPPGPPITYETVPEQGIPGLDSPDRFCAAWSRFGGSWQVILGAAVFGDDPADAFRLEVIASPVVGEAYDAVFAAWPPELAGERDVVADQYFGAFQRRSADAAAALDEAGAGAADREAISEAWIAALSVRDPEQPVLDVALPDGIDPLVTEAARLLATRRVPFPADPSMVIVAETPATDAYLTATCPDQGLLAGQDVIDGDA